MRRRASFWACLTAAASARLAFTSPCCLVRAGLPPYMQQRPAAQLGTQWHHTQAQAYSAADCHLTFILPGSTSLADGMVSSGYPNQAKLSSCTRSTCSTGQISAPARLLRGRPWLSAQRQLSSSPPRERLLESDKPAVQTVSHLSSWNVDLEHHLALHQGLHRVHADPHIRQQGRGMLDGTWADPDWPYGCQRVQAQHP